MKLWRFIALMICGMTVFLIIAHLWIGLVDGCIKKIKKLFHLDKKDKIRWHTLEDAGKIKQNDPHNREK